MQKNTRLFVFLLLGFFFFGGSVLLANAQANAPGTGANGGNPGAPTTSQYVPLENIPGCEQGNNLCSGYLPDYLQALYRFTFWAVGIAALFMLSVGGFMYVTSAGNTSRLGTAKDIIRDSLIGLVLAIVAWLFLYIINPDLVKLNLPGVVPGSSSTPQPPTNLAPPAGAVPAGSIQDLVNQIYANSNITVSPAGSCKRSANETVSPDFNLKEARAGNGQMTACFHGCQQAGAGFCSGKTQVSSYLLQAFLNVAKTTPFTITSIAGGSHSANSGHYRGGSADVDNGDLSALRAAFEKAGFQAHCDNGSFMNTLPNGQCPSGATHIHVGP